VDLKEDITSWRNNIMSKIIFDIGCNEFNFSLACKEKYPDSKIIAVDPIGEVYSFYKSKSCPDKNIIFVNKAVSDKADQIKSFYFNCFAPTLSTLSERFLDNSRFSTGTDEILSGFLNQVRDSNGKVVDLTLEQLKSAMKKQHGSLKEFMKFTYKHEKRMIQTTTLDALIKEHGNPDLIKIDVEGYELQVLKGLSTKEGEICFEWHEESSTELYDCLDRLKELGYEEFGILGFFEEGDSFNFLQYDKEGDSYAQAPIKYYDLNSIKNDLKSCIKTNRKTNWGMAWAK
jgi:FkbM family methyltransferase